MLNFHNSYYAIFFLFMFVVFNQSILVMKIRVFVDHQSTYNYLELDTDNLLVSSCVNRFTGRIHLRHCNPDDSTFKDPLPSLFISDLINDLIDTN